MTEKIDETDEGYYEKVGDVLEWRYKEGFGPPPPPPEYTEPAPQPEEKPKKKGVK